MIIDLTLSLGGIITITWCISLALASRILWNGTTGRRGMDSRFETPLSVIVVCPCRSIGFSMHCKYATESPLSE